jgi:hypothetical protein
MVFGCSNRDENCVVWIFYTAFVVACIVQVIWWDRLLLLGEAQLHSLTASDYNYGHPQGER